MLTSRSTNATSKWLMTSAFAMALAASVSGCGTSRMTTGSIARSDRSVDAMSASELQNAAGPLGKAYAANSNDKSTAMRYSAVLQMNGDNDQSLAVMRKLAIAYPKDREVLAVRRDGPG